MYGWNDFSLKNVLGAAYNQVHFIVRNLRYLPQMTALQLLMKKKEGDTHSWASYFLMEGS